MSPERRSDAIRPERRPDLSVWLRGLALASLEPRSFLPGNVCLGVATGDPRPIQRDDTQPIELRHPDVPTGRAPERDVESPGSRLYRITAPLLGRDEAARLKQITNLIDQQGPAVAETVAQAWSRFGPSSSQQPSAELGPRGSTVAIVILASTLAATLIVLGVAVAIWASSLRSDVLERSRDQDAAIATVRLESAEKAAKAVGRQDAQDRQATAMQARLDLHDQQLAEANELVTTLTKHAVSRMDAIGKKTGADQLDTWTPTPARLRIVALAAEEADAERDRKRQ